MQGTEARPATAAADTDNQVMEIVADAGWSRPSSQAAIAGRRALSPVSRPATVPRVSGELETKPRISSSGALDAQPGDEESY